MKKIIFVFSNYKRLNYWYKYIINFFGKKALLESIRYPERIIIIQNVELIFLSESNSDSFKGRRENMYWVEELFDNNFECSLIEILKKELNTEDN